MPNDIRFASLPPPALNDVGQIAFWAALSSGASSIWATDSLGILRSIARASDILEVSPGDFRTVESLFFFGSSGNSDSRPSAFNYAGQISFSVRFTDRSSGIFVSNAVVIPEPASFALIGMLMPSPPSYRRRGSQ